MSICRTGGSGLVIRLAHAQCSVITEDGEQGDYRVTDEALLAETNKYGPPSFL